MSDASPTLKRLLAGGGLLLAVVLVVVLGLGASGDGDGGGYRVRAIFDTASFIVPGEDVKSAGVKIGTVESLDVTRANKAAIVLRIDDPAFQNFKRDASCTIRLQSLIGEKFVACLPTQPKDANAPVPPELHKIGHGANKGQFLLPVQNTSSPVDVDLLSDIMRVPERQRFAIIINELGAGLAGNGKELRAVIRRADPALHQFDEVLAILAKQAHTLDALARDGDRALAPLAANSQSISQFIDKAGVTGQATAEEGDAVEASFQRLPEFLRQLTPTAKRLGEFAEAGTPVVTDLRAVAPSINRFFKQLGPFSQAALPTFRTLGRFSDVGSDALTKSQPVINDIRALGTKTRPLASRLARTLVDLQGQHGIERLLQVIFYTVGSSNGFDDLGHTLRTYLDTPNCLEYALTQTLSCSGTLTDYEGKNLPSASSGARTSSSATTPSSTPAASETTPASAPTPTPAPTSATNGGAETGLLGYLLGNGGGQ
ncbi:MAG TPA: MlaD family protein [Conexibacter sp.]|nr:MlaD family protein [Conexibacter sp.]